MRTKIFTLAGLVTVILTLVEVWVFHDIKMSLVYLAQSVVFVIIAYNSKNRE